MNNWTPADGPSREELAELKVAPPNTDILHETAIAALAAHDLYEENQRLTEQFVALGETVEAENQRLKAALRLQEETTATVTRQNMKLHDDRECLRAELAEAKRDTEEQSLAVHRLTGENRRLNDELGRLRELVDDLPVDLSET